MPEPVLFDLDGTLADTAPDLAFALNLLRQEQGLPILAFPHIRPLVSLGATAMIKFAFEIGEQTEPFCALRERFLMLYQENICRHTRLFPGVDLVLDFLDQSGIRWGIVTNKPGWLTTTLLDAIDISRRSACVISGDSLPERKPHPLPLLHACQLIGSSPEDAIYIGDAASDIQAGLKAGMRTAVAGYGYLETGADPRLWGADYIFDQPADILAWLKDESLVK